MEKNVRNDKRFGKQFAYILDAITTENYEVTCDTDAEKVKFVLETFNEEYNYKENKRRWPNLTERISEWFRCLPSVIHIEYWDYKIEKIGIEWGFEKAVKRGTFIENWWTTCATRLLQLAAKFKIDTTFLH